MISFMCFRVSRFLPTCGLSLYRGKYWRRFGWWWHVGRPAAEAEYDAVSDAGQDMVYSCKLVLQVGQKGCWQCCVCSRLSVLF